MNYVDVVAFAKQLLSDLTESESSSLRDPEEIFTKIRRILRKEEAKHNVLIIDEIDHFSHHEKAFY